MSIPETLLTGFLGSGKRTMLSRALRDPAFGDAAVLINELGAVGIDHRLARSARETRVLENGCVCCTLRDDLPAALADFYWDRPAPAHSTVRARHHRDHRAR